MRKISIFMLLAMLTAQAYSQQQLLVSRGTEGKSAVLIFNELSRANSNGLQQQTDTTKANNEFLKRKLKGLQNGPQAYNNFNNKAEIKADLQEAIRLAEQSGNKSLVNQARLTYASRIAAMNEPGESLNILKGLLPEPSFSPSERVHILCLLIINTIRLNSDTGTDAYYKELNRYNIAQYPQYRAEYLMATGMYREIRKNPNGAKQTYFSLVAGLKTDQKNRDLILEGTIRLAALFSTGQDYTSAEKYFKLADSYLQKLDRYHPLRINYLRQYNVHLNRFKKTDLLVKKLNSELLLKDSVYRRELLNTTKELLYRYQLQESEKNLRIAAQQRELDALSYEKSKQQVVMLILVLVFVIVISGLFIHTLMLRKRQADKLHQAELENMQQVNKTEKVKLLAGSQEAERRRIADQLHDEVGSMLSVARLNLSSADDDPGAVSPQQIRTATKILGDVASTIRDMSHQLMPVAIKQYGLKHAVEQLISDINMSGKILVEHIIVGMDQQEKYPDDFQVSIYRIVQELLQNTVKHSGAKNALFQLIEHKDSLNLLLEDNGSGFDMQKTDTKGIGMELLQSRIAWYEGTISIESNGSTGTLILIDIPIHNVISPVR